MRWIAPSLQALSLLQQLSSPSQGSLRKNLRFDNYFGTFLQQSSVASNPEPQARQLSFPHTFRKVGSTQLNSNLSQWLRDLPTLVHSPCLHRNHLHLAKNYSFQREKNWQATVSQQIRSRKSKNWHQFRIAGLGGFGSRSLRHHRNLLSLGHSNLFSRGHGNLFSLGHSNAYHPCFGHGHVYPVLSHAIPSHNSPCPSHSNPCPWWISIGKEWIYNYRSSKVNKRSNDKVQSHCPTRSNTQSWTIFNIHLTSHDYPSSHVDPMQAQP